MTASAMDGNVEIELVVGLGASRVGWSDQYPCEITKIVSDKCVEIRDMNAELDPSFKPNFVQGGFCGTVTNQHEQSYTYTSDPNGAVRRARKGKNGVWKLSNGSVIRFGKAHKFHDYNF